MDAMLREQFGRTLDNLPDSDPWPVLIDSGFLDLLATGLPLDALFEIAGVPEKVIDALNAQK